MLVCHKVIDSTDFLLSTGSVEDSTQYWLQPGFCICSFLWHCICRPDWQVQYKAWVNIVEVLKWNESGDKVAWRRRINGPILHAERRDWWWWLKWNSDFSNSCCFETQTKLVSLFLAKLCNFIPACFLKLVVSVDFLKWNFVLKNNDFTLFLFCYLILFVALWTSVKKFGQNAICFRSVKNIQICRHFGPPFVPVFPWFGVSCDID